MKLYIYLLIFISLPLSSLADPYIQWNSASCSQSVSPSSHFTCGYYIAKNLHFSMPIKGLKNLNKNIVPEYIINPSLTFDLYINQTLIEKNITLTNDYNFYIDTKKTLMINVSSFSDPKGNSYIIETYNPSATLTLYTRMHPQYTVSISTDKSSYDYTHDEDINVSISIKNTGSIDVNELRVNIKASELNTSSQLDFTVPLIVNQIRSYNYNFGVPHAPGTYRFNLTLTSMESNTNDKFTNYYEQDIIVSVPSPNVMITKYVPDHIYINDKVTEIITINNYGTVPIYGVGVRDDTGFVFVTNESKTKSEWGLYYIEPDSQSVIQYQIIPNKLGYSQSLPVATVNYTFMGREYQNVSNVVTMDIIDVPGFFRISVTPTPIPTPTSSPTPTPTLTPKPTVATPIPMTPEATNTPQYPYRVPGFEGTGALIIIFIVKKMYR